LCFIFDIFNSGSVRRKILNTCKYLGASFDLTYCLFSVQKTLQIKAFSGEAEEERWKRSVVDIQGEILLGMEAQDLRYFYNVL